MVLLHGSSFWMREQWRNPTLLSRRTLEVVEPRDDFPKVRFATHTPILLTKASWLIQVHVNGAGKQPFHMVSIWGGLANISTSYTGCHISLEE